VTYKGRPDEQGRPFLFRRSVTRQSATAVQVPVKQPKRRRLPEKSENGCVRHRATHRNHVGSYGLPVDWTALTLPLRQ
jgi:hypothetical protein